MECVSNSAICKSCADDGCNNRIDLPTCYVNNNTAISVSRDQVSIVCPNYRDLCFTHVSNKIVYRGCFNEYKKEKFLRKSFLTDNADNRLFKTCTTLNCNDNVYNRRLNILDEKDNNDGTGAIDIEDNEPVDIESHCYSCDTLTDISCKSNLNSEMLFLCPSATRKTVGCYHLITGEFSLTK